VLTGKIGSHGENNIHPGRILFSPEPERLPDDSFDSVSFDRATNAAVDAYAQSRHPAAVGSADQGETGTVQALAPAVDVFEVATLAQKSELLKSISGQESRAKPFAPSGPPGLQDRATTSGAHPFPKSMGALAFENAGLKGSFAHQLRPHAVMLTTAMLIEIMAESPCPWRQTTPKTIRFVRQVEIEPSGTTDYKTKILTTYE